MASNQAMIWAAVVGTATVFGTFTLQHWLLKLLDPLIVALGFQVEPLVALIFAIIANVQELEYSSIVMYALFLVLPNMLIVAGIRQFEDKYEGGFMGLSTEQRNDLRIEHLRELQRLGVGDTSETMSKQ